MRITTAIIIVMGFIVALGVAMPMIGTDPGVCDTYHEMRHTYEATDGEYGWPEGAVRGCGDE